MVSFLRQEALRRLRSGPTPSGRLSWYDKNWGDLEKI